MEEASFSACVGPRQGFFVHAMVASYLYFERVNPFKIAKPPADASGFFWIFCSGRMRTHDDIGALT
ncbi:hypothetical protein OHD57_24150 [Paenibacillus polysaccharolyticus]|uniref:hypothetical protein n=1 Tax=Paenibacillus cucumis (ex Kampfer et al. 2016) TaxID=1776858 RepID=UPI001C8EF1E5|nr:hypothetical protein [Paenibacillus cucumis (ex Kampfer et al. 2016)]